MAEYAADACRRADAAEQRAAAAEQRAAVAEAALAQVSGHYDSRLHDIASQAAQAAERLSLDCDIDDGVASNAAMGSTPVPQAHPADGGAPGPAPLQNTIRT